MPLDVNGCWWKASKQNIGSAMVCVAKHLFRRDDCRRTEAQLNLERFHGKTIRGMVVGDRPHRSQHPVRVNITKSAIETITAKVGKNRPRPTVLTNGADHALTVRAKELQKFLDGAYSQADVYSKAPLVFRDAMLMGDGILYTYADHARKRIACERVFPLEMLVDAVEGVNGTPRCAYRVKYMDRDTLAEMFPSKALKIARLPSVNHEDTEALLPDDPETEWSPRTVQVFEAWRLAGCSYDGESVPGKHVLGVEGETLFEEDYDHDFFPFERFTWCQSSRGYWGDSAAAEIRGIEKSVNRRLQRIDRAYDLASNPWVLIPRGSKVPKGKITNEIGVIIEYEGTEPPKIQVHQAVDPQASVECWALYAKAFEILGTNQLQSSATKPPGIESGKALQQLGEEHQVRFATQQYAWEDMIGKRLPRQFLRCAKELDTVSRERTGKGWELKAVANKTAIRIRWTDAEISPDDFFVECYPTSILPHLPSGRTEAVAFWQQQGWLTPAQSKSLLDFPDLESVANVAEADQEMLDAQIDAMLDQGTPTLPEPRQDLMQAATWGTYRLFQALTDGHVPEDHCQLLRDFLNAIDDLRAQAVPPPVEPPLMPIADMGIGPLGPQGPVPPPPPV